MDVQDLQSETGEGRFVVYLRFPFPRNGFQDPVVCEWNDEKEQKLREYISSRTLQRGDIDWINLAKRFDVSVPFILQQAIWLYERELEHVRGQMLRVNRNVFTNKPQDLVKTVTRDNLSRPRGGDRQNRERASSSFSPRRGQFSNTEDGTSTTPTSRKLAISRTEPAPTSSSPKFHLHQEGASSPSLGKSSDSGSSATSIGSGHDALASSRRLLSMSRTFNRPKPPSNLREGRLAEEGSNSLSSHSENSVHSGFEDDLDEDLYDAFLPMDLKPRKPVQDDSTPGESVTFSDLSDTSISKSALEEALLSDYRTRGLN